MRTFRKQNLASIRRTKCRTCGGWLYRGLYCREHAKDGVHSKASTIEPGFDFETYGEANPFQAIKLMEKELR